jgi:hypothetical protein
MKLLISGEGPSDIGACNNAQGVCMDDAFSPGPMAIWLERLWEALLGYELLNMPEAVVYVSEKTLAQDSKQSGRRLQSLRGKEKQVETGWYYSNAEQLGLRAKALSAEYEAPIVAILFRDADSTRSAPGQLWQTKWESMLAGFKAADFDFGVPMVPKPKSEAWLLCATQLGNHSHAALEEISGNDKSPNSAKVQLDQFFGEHQSAAQLADWCQTNPVDWSKLMTMPSFKAFSERFHVVANAILRPAAA